MTIAPATDRRPAVIGRDCGPIGRVFRLLACLAAVTVAARPPGTWMAGLMWLAVIAAGYVVLLAIMRPWLVDREHGGLTGFVGSALMLVPLLAYPLGLLPPDVAIGVALYDVLSLFAAGVLGYGGLELAALPSLLLRFRPVLYSQYNFVDLIERYALGRPVTLLTTGAGVLGTVGALWFWSVEPVLAATDGDSGSDALLVGSIAVLVVGGLVLLGRGLSAGERPRRIVGIAMILFGLGGAVGAMPDAIYALILPIGILLGGQRAIRAVAARRRRCP